MIPILIITIMIIMIIVTIMTIVTMIVILIIMKVDNQLCNRPIILVSTYVSLTVYTKAKFLSPELDHFDAAPAR